MQATRVAMSLWEQWSCLVQKTWVVSSSPPTSTPSSVMVHDPWGVT